MASTIRRVSKSPFLFGIKLKKLIFLRMARRMINLYWLPHLLISLLYSRPLSVSTAGSLQENTPLLVTNEFERLNIKAVTILVASPSLCHLADRPILVNR